MTERVVAEVERKPISTAAEIVWAKSPPRDDITPTQDVRPRRNRGRARAVVFLSGFTLLCVGMAATFVWYVVTVRTGGTLELETVPAIVQVLVDNQLVHTGTTPITLQGLTRGPHIILVRAEGHREESKHVDVVDGVKSRLLIQLTRGPPPVGSVRVVTEPAGARVTIDGRLREGTTPMVIGGLTPGPHTVGADKPPHLVGERVVEVKEARTQDVAVPLAARSVSLKLTSSPSGALFRIEDSEGELHAEGATPDEVGELLSGNAYMIQITLKGRRNWSKRYTPVGAGPHALHADLLFASGRSESRSSRGGRAVASRRPKRTRRPASVDSEDAPPIRPIRREIPSPRPPPTPAPIAARAPAPAQAAYGLLNLNAKPWAKVFIDGRDTGQSTPMLGQRLPVGRRKITLVNGRFGIHKEFWVDIRPGKTSQLIVDLQQ